jgi:restriction endonuclease S subunit
MSKLYELPDGWEWKKLEDISKKIFAGGDKPKEVSETVTENLNIPIYANGVKNNGLYGYTNIYKVNEECLTISARGTIGFTVVRTEKFLPIVRLIVVIPNNTILSKILKYYLDYEIVANTGSSIPQLTVPTVKKLNFPLPPIQEQKRIVAKLDTLFEKIDKSIALHQKNMDEADVFMRSVLNEVFEELQTNENVSLKNITSKIGSGSTPRGGQKSYKKEGISLIRSMNVHDNGFREKGLAFIDDEQAKKLAIVTLQENDVLLNITGASVARCCIVDKNYLPARVNQHVSILRLKDEILPKFLHYYLTSPIVKTELLKSSSGGATREAITKTMLEEFQVPVVPLFQQEKITTYLDEISKKIEKIKQVQKEKMESLVALKASILDQAFRGEL